MKVNFFKNHNGLLRRVLLQILLAIFAFTNLAAGVLTTIAARVFPQKHAELFKIKAVRESLTGGPYLWWINNGQSITRDPVEYLSSCTRVPFIFLAVLFFIAWFITCLVLLKLFTEGRHFKNRVAHYVFRTMALITLVFLIALYYGWSESVSLEFPFAMEWTFGIIATLAAHINLAIAILITLVAAVLDTPKDWASDASTGPNSRRSTRA